MLKVFLIPLGLISATSAADLGIYKKVLGSGRRCHSSPSSAPKATKLIISNDEANNIIKIVKCLEDSGLLLKGVSETIGNEFKEKKGRFPSMLLGTLGVNRAGERALAKRQSRRNKVEEL